MRPVVYLVGSLRNPKVATTAQVLRAAGYEVFDDWLAPGPHCDAWWQRYERHRGRTYLEALRGYHVRHVYEFDKYHLDRADIGVLVMPAGKSAHMELGYLKGRGKRTFVLLDREPRRWDVMYLLHDGVFLDLGALLVALRDGP